MKTILMTIANMLAILILLVGLFLAIAGPLSGLGTDTIVAKAGYCCAGLTIIDVYALYRLAGRSWSKLFDNLVSVIFFSAASRI